jgi:hypothetical protein
MFGSNSPSIKGDSSPIVDDDPSFDPCDDELIDEKTKKKKFTDINQ